MDAKKIEKFEKTNLRNISTNLYSFLKNNYGKRININNEFDFDDYKEAVRYELVNFCSDFTIFANSSNEELRRIAYKKRLLKEYIDEILDNEYMLDNFTIYKIQQFINRVGKKLLDNNYSDLVTITKVEEGIEYREKYLEYKDIEIEATPIIGFPSADKVISYLYREFGLKKLNPSEYEDSFLLDNKPDTKLLFKAGININERNQKVIGHPVKDDETIFLCLCENFVADKAPKRVLKKVIEEDVEDILTE